MQATAVVLEKPLALSLAELRLTPPTLADVVVDIAYSGISTGTERLLWSGRMPEFPGLGYPLVPGYESVGTVVEAGSLSGRREGEQVFVPGANCYGEVRGLFGGSAQRVVTAGAKVVPVGTKMREQHVLLALAATAYHAILAPRAKLPDLIVGHGVLGRLMARLTIAAGGAPPVVWERDAARRAGADGYTVVDPETDENRAYKAIYDVSGDAGILDALVQRLAKGCEITLAGFYDQRPSFSFPPAFMREMHLRVSAEWQPEDLRAVTALVAAGRLSLDGLVTHTKPAAEAAEGYRTAFGDPSCLKMILDWRQA